MKRRFLRLSAAAFLALASFSSFAQIQLGQAIEIKPEVDYEIGGITVTGADQLDPTMVGLLSGLNVGDKVQFPSERVGQAIRNLWDQELFSDVQLFVVQKVNRTVYLEFRLTTLPKLSKYYFTGIKKGKQDALRELLELTRGMVVSENLKITAENAILKHFKEKGFPMPWQRSPRNAIACCSTPSCFALTLFRDHVFELMTSFFTGTPP